MKQRLLQQVHDTPAAGHPGMVETLRKLQEYMSWPGMRSYVKSYIKGCPHCQQNKIRRQLFKPPLQPVPGPKTL